VLLSVLLVLLLFAVLQVAVFVYARNVVSAAAADAARYAANAGVDPADGDARARQVLRDGLPDRAAAAIACHSEDAVDTPSGLDVARVRCRGRLPMLLLPFDIPLDIDVSSAVVKEHAP
jgi:Flp pilus assembly protein TadG